MSWESSSSLSRDYGGYTYGKEEELSEHMRSRKEVGEILKKSTADVTIFKSAVILVRGGGSFKMLQYYLIMHYSKCEIGIDAYMIPRYWAYMAFSLQRDA